VDAITRAAITGTSREAPPAGDLPTDHLLGSAQDRNPERDLLLRAGMYAVYRAAGHKAEIGVEAPVPAPEEMLRACSAKASEVVRRLLADRRDDILREALGRLRLAGLRLPYALLPAVLGVQQRELRAAAITVLGERGRWLARFDPAWRWVNLQADAGTAEVDEAAWEEGSLPERLDALRRVRRLDADQGLRWVDEVWKAEKAEARAGMVTALETGLYPGDEPLLERALDDRSVRVREAAAELLARIPGSAYAERAVARAGFVLVRYDPPTPGLLRGRQVGKFVVEPPEDVDGGWRRDLPDVDKAPRGTGEGAWRISQALAAVPLDHWEAHFDVGPEELVAAAGGNDWEPALLLGWCQAGASHADPGWAWPLWERCYRLPEDPEANQVWSAVVHLAPWLPQERLAEALPRMLQGRSVEMSGRLASTLLALPAAWAPDLSRVYVERLYARLRMLAAKPPSGDGQQWARTLPHAAAALSPDVLETAIGMDAILQRSKGEQDWSVRWLGAELRKFDETLELRRKLVEEIPL
jgi:hypothetical protein